MQFRRTDRRNPIMNPPRHSGAVRWLTVALTAVAAVAAFGASLTWSASRDAQPAGSAINFTPHGTQPGLAHVIEDPIGCSGCHGSWDPSSGAADFIAYNTWSGSMMAHATRDPVFWAALDVANADIPGVGDFCLRCHTPQGWLAGRVRTSPTGEVI